MHFALVNPNPTAAENKVDEAGKPTNQPAVALLEDIEVHLIEIIIGVEYFGDGVVNACEDLLLVSSDTFNAVF